MRRLTLLTVATATLTTALAAQQRGPEFSVGLGGGAIRVNCDNCGEPTFSGSGTLQLNVMFPVDRRVLLGVGLAFAESGEAENEANIRSIAAELRWAPNLDRGFTARAGYGLGFTNSALTDTTGTRYVNDLTGMLVTVGLGWRFPISKRLALEPQVRTYIAPWGSVRTPGPFLQNIITTNFAALVTLSWR